MVSVVSVWQFQVIIHLLFPKGSRQVFNLSNTFLQSWSDFPQRFYSSIRRSWSLFSIVLNSGEFIVAFSTCVFMAFVSVYRDCLFLAVSDIISSCSEHRDFSFPGWFATKHKIDQITGLTYPTYQALLMGFHLLPPQSKTCQELYSYQNYRWALNGMKPFFPHPSLTKNSA